jgi:hypothetical protein
VKLSAGDKLSSVRFGSARRREDTGEPVVMESKAEDWNSSEKQSGGHEIGVSLGIAGLLGQLVIVDSE